MVALEQLKRIREMAINKMNEIIRVAEGRFEARDDGFLEEPKAETEVLVATEEPLAETEVVEVPSEPKATRPRRGEKGGVNKSALIRDYFEKHSEAKNSEVIEYMKKVYNLEAMPSLVSTVKVHMKKPKKAGRPKKAETKAKGRRGRKSKGGLPMVACVTRVLSKSKSKQGSRAEDILEGVKKLGYVYSGDKGDAGFLNCVYQALHDLSKDKARSGWKGSGPVLLHDKETHTWKLNPRAERKIA